MSLLLLIFLLFIVFGVIILKVDKTTFRALKLYVIIMSLKKPIRWPGFVMPIKKEEVTLRLGKRILKPDLYYLPIDKKLPAMIIYCPLAVEGKHNRNIIHFMKGLSRLGFLAVAAFWPERKLGQIHPDDPEEVQALIDYVYQHPRVDKERISLIGISYGIGPILKAMSNQPYQNKIKSIVSVGGYANLRELFEFILTGKFVIDDQLMQVNADPYGQYALLRTMNQFFRQKQDRQKIDHFLNQASAKNDLHFEELLLRISSSARKILRQVFLSPTPNLDALPPELKKITHDLSIASSAFILRKPLLILHSTRDRLIPYSQSIKLYDLFKSNPGTQFFLINAFDHALPRQVNLTNFVSVYILNLVKMMKFLYQVLKNS